MNVSSTLSASWFVVIVPLPLVAPEAIPMLASVPWSSGSAESSVIVTGIVTLPDSAADSVAVTVTVRPSTTGFGDADSRTVGVVGVAPAPSTRRRETVSPSDQLRPVLVQLIASLRNRGGAPDGAAVDLEREGSEAAGDVLVQINADRPVDRII